MTQPPRQGDVVAAIKAAVNPGKYDLMRAEGRADFDDALRAELAKIGDVALARHAGQMIREWREKMFNAPARHRTTAEELLARCAAIRPRILARRDELIAQRLAREEAGEC